jgi:hypothetical protein
MNSQVFCTLCTQSQVAAVTGSVLNQQRQLTLCRGRPFVEAQADASWELMNSAHPKRTVDQHSQQTFVKSPLQTKSRLFNSSGGTALAGLLAALLCSAW